jgi:hypothetical protein
MKNVKTNFLIKRVAYQACQDSHLAGCDLNPGTSEFEAAVLTTKSNVWCHSYHTCNYTLIFYEKILESVITHVL